MKDYIEEKVEEFNGKTISSNEHFMAELKEALQEAYNKGREEERDKQIKLLEEINTKLDYLLELKKVIKNQIEIIKFIDSLKQ